MGYRGYVLGCIIVLIACHSLSETRFVKAEILAPDDAASTGSPVIDEKVGAVPTGSETDTQTQQRENESTRKSGEKFQFQAEVSRLMDIIINSLYSNKDIFLRELISNASDALDKIRFLALTDKNILGEGDQAKLEIQIKLDKDKNILTIRDRGIGMTKEDLIKNLGTIAKSGTSAFLEQMQKGGDLNLIGQFGVGFYSVYLVADYVEVRSKHNDDTQWVWTSKADGNFEVYEDTEGEALGRGTEIAIHLKEEASEYSTEWKLKELVTRYSEFINFPISLWSSREVDVPAPDEEVEEESDEAPDTEDASDDEEEEEEDEDEDDEGKKGKTVKETVWEWEVLNDVKAVWLRSPQEVTKEEYIKFYKSFSKDMSPEDPISWSHFNAEGDVEFKAILYIPPKAPGDMWDNYYSSAAKVKLYVRRVFISEDMDELLPRYLNFLRGIVDSDTLPLNVSREMLQQHSSLKTMKKKLVRKALDMIRRIAEEDEDETKKDKEEEEEEDEEKSASKGEGKGKYAKFFAEYGKSIKLGIIEDSSNRIRLAKLLRFTTSKSEDKLTSLDEYVERMKEEQKQIYYITGQSTEQLKKSPFLEKLLKDGYEVIFFTDAVDEYLMQNLTEYDDKKFQNASKDDLKLKGDKAREKKVKETFKSLMSWWKEELGTTAVEAVKVSNRLADTPCVVVTSKYGWSANMERIMSAQALSDSSKQSYMKGRKTLEINPRHPIIKSLRELVEKDKESAAAKQIGHLLFETAMLESGFVLEDPSSFAARVYGAVGATMDIDPNERVEEEEEVTEAEVQAEVEEEQSMEKRFETEVEGDGSVKGPDGDDWYPMNVVDDLEEGGETVPASEGEVKDEL